MGVVVVLAIAGTIWLGIGDTHFFQQARNAAASQDVHNKPRSNEQKVFALPREHARAYDSEATRSIYREIRDSKDLRATVNELRSLPDPSGDISYQLGRAVQDCMDRGGGNVRWLLTFIAPTPNQALRARHERLVNERADRCKGFEFSKETVALYDALYDQAIQAKHPAALARSLHRDLVHADVATKDALATRLLSESPYPDVIEEIKTYLNQRNSGLALDTDEVVGAGDSRYRIASSAWSLLECDLGQDCGIESSTVVRACLFQGRCSPTNVTELVKNLELPPEEYPLALAIKTRLLEALQAKDWVRFGFYPVPGKKGV